MARRNELSAGLLAFRRKDQPEFLLAHPGGPFWARKDQGAWTIPKGLVRPDGLLAGAQREFSEETGFASHGPFIALAPVKQRSGKVVHAFAFEADYDPAAFCSNSFELEWPPKSGQMRSYPEVDRVGWFAFEPAVEKIIAYQRPFLVELKEKLDAASATRATLAF